MKKLPVYMAGSPNELTRVRKWADVLERSNSVRITRRWFDADAKPATAEDTLRAIRDARAFWFLLPATLAGDSMIEYGYALGHLRRGVKLQVIASGANLPHTAFSGLAHERFELDVHAFQSILQSASRRMSGVG